MDTIDRLVIDQVATLVAQVANEEGMDVVHTVTICLSGMHGGADVVILGTHPEHGEWQAVRVVR